MTHQTGLIVFTAHNCDFTGIERYKLCDLPNRKLEMLRLSSGAEEGKELQNKQQAADGAGTCDRASSMSSKAQMQARFSHVSKLTRKTSFMGNSHHLAKCVQGQRQGAAAAGSAGVPCS